MSFLQTGSGWLATALTALMFLPCVVVGFVWSACEAGFNCGKEIYDEAFKP